MRTALLILAIATAALGLENPFAEPTISYPTLICTLGVAIPNHDPTLGGGTTDSVKAITALPTGLSVTKTGANKGRISGTPTAGSSGNYTIRAYGCANADATLSITLVKTPRIIQLLHSNGRIGYVDTLTGRSLSSSTVDLWGTVSTPVTVTRNTMDTIIWIVPTSARGTFWLRVQTDFGRDSVPFRVLVPGGSVTP